MANMNKKRTEPIRSDPNYAEWIKELSRLKTFQEKQPITPARLTQAIFNLRKKYPIDDEIKLAKLGKWKPK